MRDFLAMGGYAPYIWSSYGLALLVLVANIALPLYRHRRLLQALQRRARLRRTAS